MQLLPSLPAAVQLGLVQTVALAGPGVMKAFSTGGQALKGQPGGARTSRPAHGRSGALARCETAGGQPGFSTGHGALVGVGSWGVGVSLLYK